MAPTGQSLPSILSWLIFEVVAPREIVAEREFRGQMNEHMDGILALPAPFLRMTLCSHPIGQKPFGKQRSKPPDLVGLCTLDTNFGENDFLIERASCF